MAYYCCFRLGGNQDFLEFLQKTFYNINYWKKKSKNEFYIWENIERKRERERERLGQLDVSLRKRSIGVWLQGLIWSRQIVCFYIVRV